MDLIEQFSSGLADRTAAAASFTVGIETGSFGDVTLSSSVLIGNLGFSVLNNSSRVSTMGNNVIGVSAGGISPHALNPDTLQ